jgi:cellulose synthase/poly-beta-1,6-N-acetylglucosamine synthase-like glycosyltransferase
MKIKILIPIYNDWQSVFKLLENIDSETKGLEDEASVIIVNDASTEQKPEININLNNIKSVQVINMKENKGHARCNAAGLKYINEKEDFDYVIPMDGDGEDRPEEIKLLIKKAKEYPNTVITANRVKRSEGFIFKSCYLIHKYLTYIFTGQSIKFGNYTCLPKFAADKMSKEAATWSSFSGSLSKIAKERKSVPSIRGLRYFGPSKMSFFNLLKHSLSIIAVFKNTVLIRSIIFLVVYFFLVSQHISVVILIPVLFVILMVISVFALSRRENITELNSSLENINDIENFK